MLLDNIIKEQTNTFNNVEITSHILLENVRTKLINILSLIDTHTFLIKQLEEVSSLELASQIESFLERTYGSNNSLNSSSSNKIINEEYLEQARKLISQLNFKPVRGGRGYRLFLETAQQIPTIFFIKELFALFKNSSKFIEILNTTGTITITFNVFNSER